MSNMTTKLREALTVLADLNAAITEGECAEEALADALESQDAALLLLDLAAFALNRAPAPGVAMMTKREAWRTSVQMATIADDELNGEWQPKA